MIMVIDVGNTNITCGVYDGKNLLTSFRLTTKIQRTSDEYGSQLHDMLTMNGLSEENIRGTAIASVVPNVMYALTSAITKYLGHTPLVVSPGVKSGIRIMIDNPRSLGADRIVDAVAAYEKYGGPVLVLDFGTATTYDIVTKDGAFVGGATTPGLRISLDALSKGAAKLPEVEIRKPKSIIARDTITSMQAGLVYGQIGQTEYIIRQMKKETGYEDMKVVATGGLGRMIAEETSLIDIYDDALTLEGLRIVYEKNMRFDTETIQWIRI